MPALLTCFFLMLCFVSKIVVCLHCYLGRLQDLEANTALEWPDPPEDSSETYCASVRRVWASCKFGSQEPKWLEVHRVFVSKDPEKSELSWLKYEHQPTKQLLKPSTTGADLQQVCVCCLEEFHTDAQVAILPCGHTFHEPCIARWSLSATVGTGNMACPFCRTPFDAHL